jgi:hypothetical protein
VVTYNKRYNTYPQLSYRLNPAIERLPYSD